MNFGRHSRRQVIEISVKSSLSTYPDLTYDLLMSPEWKSFDPSWLIALAKVQLPDDEWLVESLERCKKASYDGVSYYFFVERERANDQNSEWEFARNVSLRDSEKGEIILDILRNNWVGGMEFIGDYEN